MSDTPQGEGWWQASDLKWYPPPPDRTRRWVLPGAVIAAIALVAATVAVLVIPTSDEADASVLMEPATTAGPDPFMSSVTIAEISEFPDTVEAVITTTAESLDTDPATGTLTATGDAPGLYGGTRDDATCDTDALTDFLTDPDNTDKATAFANAAGTDPDGLTTYLDTLTPTLLTLDTRVTNHGYRDGRAIPRQSVLQAGTAVLVDDLGVPMVRCSCGNPLTNPEPLDLTTATTTGTTWTTWTPARTTTPTPAPTPQTTLTLLDVATGDTYQQPTGAARAELVIAAARSGEAGAVLVSSNGVDWVEAATTEVPAVGAATSEDGTAIVLADTTLDDRNAVAILSEDGIEWSEPVELPGPASTLAHGDDRWLAAGRDGSAPEAVLTSSPDGHDWTDAGTIPFTAEGQGDLSITFLDGAWLALSSPCAGATGRGCEYEVATSTDGAEWSVTTLPGDDVPGYPTGKTNVVADDDDGWRMLQVRLEEEWDGAEADRPAATRLRSSSDGTTWSEGAVTPELASSALVRFGESWLATALDIDTTAIIIGDDAPTGETVAELPVAVEDLAVLRVRGDEPSLDGLEAPTTTGPPITEPPATAPPTTAPPETAPPPPPSAAPSACNPAPTPDDAVRCYLAGSGRADYQFYDLLVDPAAPIYEIGTPEGVLVERVRVDPQGGGWVAAFAHSVGGDAGDDDWGF